MKKQLSFQIKVGLFVFLGITITCILLTLVGGTQNPFEKRLHYTTELEQADGLSVGSLIKIGGVRVGQIESLDIDTQGSVHLVLSIRRKYGNLIKKDSVIKLLTQGVLGDKYLMILPGNDAALLPEFSLIPSEKAEEFKDFLSKGQKVAEKIQANLDLLEKVLSTLSDKKGLPSIMSRTAEISEHIKTSSKNFPETSQYVMESSLHLRNILQKVDRGDGSLGAILNDMTLYDDLKALLGSANKNKLVRYFIRKSLDDAHSRKDSTLKKDRPSEEESSSLNLK